MLIFPLDCSKLLYMNSSQNGRYNFLPFILTFAVLASDQISKAWVVRTIPVGTLYREYLGDFLWIVHVRNTGAAFSMGAGQSDIIRLILFIVFPLVMMAFITVMICSPKSSLSDVQRWFAAGILGGGLGTIADRIFRFSEGVVDFISVKFYGIFGMDRWPTFNVSDSCVVVFVTLLAVSLLFTNPKNDMMQQKDKSDVSE